jgi:hypothetical protein
MCCDGNRLKNYEATTGKIPRQLLPLYWGKLIQKVFAKNRDFAIMFFLAGIIYSLTL